MANGTWSNEPVRAVHVGLLSDNRLLCSIRAVSAEIFAELDGLGKTQAI